MNDRELLELAAKAAGITILRHGKTDGAFIDNGESWSPLTEDGAALRLAVKLKLDVAIDDYVQVSWWAIRASSSG